MHVHAQGHDRSAGHSHPHTDMAAGVLAAAVAATAVLVAAELLGGYLGHSISLVSDALHNLSDIPTMLISWCALRWAARPADHERTFGYQRAGVLAAFTNAILLILVALVLFWEAFRRFRYPVAVHEGWMIGVSLLALAINGGITLALVRSRRDLNLRSLLLHNFGDAISNIRIPDMHMDESERILKNILERLDADFHITHTTIQFERAGLPQHAGYYMPQPFQSSK